MIAPAEDAVKEVDKNWTRDEIAKKIGELKIPGDFQQSINGLGAKVARIEGQLSVPTRPPHPWITPLIAVAGTAFVAFQAWMGVTTYQHGTKLSGMQTALLQIGITIAANTPADPKSQAEAKVALAEARKNPSKPLSKQTVEQAGSKFVEASPGDQNTWNVALEFAEYQSSQNTGLVPKAADKKTPTNYGGGNFLKGLSFQENKGPPSSRQATYHTMTARKWKRGGYTKEIPRNADRNTSFWLEVPMGWMIQSCEGFSSRMWKSYTTAAKSI